MGGVWQCLAGKDRFRSPVTMNLAPPSPQELHVVMNRFFLRLPQRVVFIHQGKLFPRQLERVTAGRAPDPVIKFCNRIPSTWENCQSRDTLMRFVPFSYF